jgi:hypothetical protein
MMGLLQQEKCMENYEAAAGGTTKAGHFIITHTHKHMNERTIDIRFDSCI